MVSICIHKRKELNTLICRLDYSKILYSGSGDRCSLVSIYLPISQVPDWPFCTPVLHHSGIPISSSRCYLWRNTWRSVYQVQACRLFDSHCSRCLFVMIISSRLTWPCCTNKTYLGPYSKMFIRTATKHGNLFYNTEAYQSKLYVWHNTYDNVYQIQTWQWFFSNSNSYLFADIISSG